MHPYFNSDIPIEETSPSTIKLISPREYSVGSENVSIQLEVSDSDGLYQVLLIAYFIGSPDMVACRGVMGKKNTVATFDYDGFFSSVGFRTVRGLPEHSFRVLAVDVAGNISSYLFRLSEDASELPTIMKVSGDGQQDRPGAMLAHPLVVEVRDHSGNLLPNAQVTFTVTTGEGKLSGRFSIEQTTTDANGRAESMLTLGPNPGVNIVEVTIAGREPVTFNVEGVGTPTTPSVDGDLQKWHLPDGAIVRLGKGLLGESDRSVAFSPDGQRFAVASGIGVWLYEVTTSRALALLPTVSRVTSVAFSPDGTMLASGSNDGDIELWDVATGTYIAAFGHWIHGLETTSVSFSPDGTMLASGASDATVKLWDVETGRISTSFGPNLLEIDIVAFSPDGTTIASGWFGSDFNLWDVATGTNTLLSTIENGIGLGQPLSFSFSYDGILASGHPWGIVLWDVAIGTQITTFPSNWAQSVVFSPDGTTLASGEGDGTVLLWDVVTGENIAVLAGYIGWGNLVNSVSFSPDGTTLASGAEDGTVLLWDMTAYVTPVVNIPDANLRAVIRDALGKSRSAPITSTDMASLTTLDASNRNIHDLTGLEFATNLTALNLKNNRLSSLSINTHIPALQRSGVAVLFDKPITPDFDGDGTVGISDFLLFVDQFGFSQEDVGYDARFDLDGDGVIGVSDFLIFVNSFGKRVS